MNLFQSMVFRNQRQVVVRALTFALTILSLHLTGCGRDVRWENISKVKDIALVGNNNAWIVTINGDLMRTEDGGNHWQKTPGQAVGGFECASAFDRQVGLAVNHHGQIWRTVDSGNTWNKISELRAEDWVFNESNQIEFVDELHGWIIETFTIWRTEDGGASWQKCFSRSDQKAKGQPGRAFFLDSRSGWVCGTEGEVYITKDGGKGWETRVISSRNSDFTDIFFLDRDKGWLIGYGSRETNSRTYHTVDGGNHWELLPLGSLETLVNAISFQSDNEGWAVGDVTDQHGKSTGVVLHTSDAGKTWQLSFNGNDEPFFSDLYFTDANTGWLVGRDKVYRTEDSGRSWKVVLQLAAIAPS